jgi:serine palmitoyltransferase small subunit
MSIDSLLLLVISMFLAAAYIYLPNHVITICHRIWYYWAGDPFSTDLPFADISTSSPGAAATGNDALSVVHREGYEVVKKAAETAIATARRVAEL